MTPHPPDTAAWLSPPADISLPPASVQVWAASIATAGAVLEPLAQMLSPAEQARVARYRFPADRARGILGRAMARRLLARFLAVPAEGIAFDTNPQGKPLLGGAHAASGVHFNIAHSGDLVLAAFAREAPVGVDVEAADRRAEFEKLAQRFFAPEEAAALMSVPAAERPAAFLRCWTRKEAYIKAEGMGLSIPLDSFTVRFLPGEPCALHWVRDAPEAPAQWALHNLNLGPGYAAAVAVRARGRELVCRDLRENPAWLIG